MWWVQDGTACPSLKSDGSPPCSWAVVYHAQQTPNYDSQFIIATRAVKFTTLLLCTEDFSSICICVFCFHVCSSPQNFHRQPVSGFLSGWMRTYISKKHFHFCEFQVLKYVRAWKPHQVWIKFHHLHACLMQISKAGTFHTNYNIIEDLFTADV